jgi:uncharacterized membrane protein (DUF2068 family)
VDTPFQQANPALRAFALFKLLRGGLSLVAAVVIASFVVRGGASSLQAVSHALREHWTTGVSGRIAEWLVALLDVRHAWLAIAGLTLDGGVTVLEGYALWRGERWGYWLVVLVAAAFVPFELWSLVHEPTIGRALLLLGNVVIAVYLARHVLRETRVNSGQRGTNT